MVELMVVVAIAAVLLAIAVPSFQSAMRLNRLNAAADSFAAALNTARAEAAKQGVPVTVFNVSGSNDWSGGWQVCCVPGAAALPPPPPAPAAPPAANLLITPSPLPSPMKMYSSAGAAAGLQFDPAGRLVIAGSVPPPSLVFAICADGTTYANNGARAVLIAPSGRVRVAQNPGGTPVLDDGTTLASCTTPP